MIPPTDTTEYVPFGLFEWAMGIIIAWGVIHSGMLLRLNALKVKVELYDRRFDDLMELLEREHKEHQQNLQQSESEVNGELRALRASIERLMIGGRNA